MNIVSAQNIVVKGKLWYKNVGKIHKDVQKPSKQIINLRDFRDKYNIMDNSSNLNPKLWIFWLFYRYYSFIKNKAENS